MLSKRTQRFKAHFKRIKSLILSNPFAIIIVTKPKGFTFYAPALFLVIFFVMFPNTTLITIAALKKRRYRFKIRGTEESFFSSSDSK